MATTNAQDLSKHKWEDRLVILLTDKTSNKNYEKQLEKLLSDKDGLKERKLVLYHATPEKYRQGISETGDWNEGSWLYDMYKKKDSDFEFILIGLDGTVKKRETSLISLAQLFAVIDVMPMRQEELRKKIEE